jgi:hypothetical protein
MYHHIWPTMAFEVLLGQGLEPGHLQLQHWALGTPKQGYNREGGQARHKVVQAA